MKNAIRTGIMLAATLVGVFPPAVSGAQSTGGAPIPDLPEISVERLANGIRLVHLPDPTASGESVAEVSFGYVPADGGSTGLRKLFDDYMMVSIPGRSVALAAYLAGGEFETLGDPDRIGIRVRVPRAGLADLAGPIARYFSHAIVSFEVFEYARRLEEAARTGVASPEQIDAVRDEVEAALFDRLGPEPVFEAGATGLAAVQSYLDTYAGTDRAYVVTSDRLPPEAIAALEGVAFRGSAYEPEVEAPGDGTIELRFPSRSEGGVVIATTIPSPRYDSWFSALVIDQLLLEGAGPEDRLDFRIAPRESIHLIQTTVHLPDYSEDVRDQWISRIQNVLFESVPPAELDRLKAEVIGRLDERPMLEWFAAHGLWESLAAGREMLRDLTPDGLRSRALAFVGARRAIALWSPAFEQPRIEVADLSPAGDASLPVTEPEIRPVPGTIPIPRVSAFEAAALSPVRLERLDSGVTLAEDDRHLIVVAGRFEGALTGGEVLESGVNGTLWSFAEEPSDEVLDQLDAVRADRLLFFYPEVEIAGARRRFETWPGGAADGSPPLTVGEVATADLGGLVVLKTWLDARLIQAGWWGRVVLRIDGIEGSRLVIDGDPELESIVRSWITEIAREGIDESDFILARNAAAGHFQRLRRELQIILWQRAPEGAIPPPANFTFARFRDIAGTYFDYSD